jgi:sarcosine oxidase subunit beta
MALGHRGDALPGNGNLPLVEDVYECGMALMSLIRRARLLRGWGVMDMR